MSLQCITINKYLKSLEYLEKYKSFKLCSVHLKIHQSTIRRHITLLQKTYNNELIKINKGLVSLNIKAQSLINSINVLNIYMEWEIFSYVLINILNKYYNNFSIKNIHTIEKKLTNYDLELSITNRINVYYKLYKKLFIFAHIKNLHCKKYIFLIHENIYGIVSPFLHKNNYEYILSSSLSCLISLSYNNNYSIILLEDILPHNMFQKIYNDNFHYTLEINIHKNKII